MGRYVGKFTKLGALVLATTLPLSAVADPKNPQAVFDQMQVFSDVLAIVQSE